MKLVLHREDIDSIFDLLGRDENGLTYALGWNFQNNRNLLRIFLQKVTSKEYRCDDESSEVRLQEFGEKDRGYTDIELLIDSKTFLIIEAKIGCALPTQDQLDKYGARFQDYKTYDRKLVVISECRKEYARQQLKKLEVKIPIEYISWREILRLIEVAYNESSGYQKKMLYNLTTYFKKVIRMQRRDSNKVFCVSLSSEKPKWSRLSWIDIVKKKRKYFYPVGKNWPSDPPNYIAFRYDGKLQSIHHVDTYQIATKMHEHLPVDEEEWNPHFLLTLGTPFKPAKVVKNGRIWPNGRYWIDLDALFTCATIREARDLTQQRTEAI
ncbi:MAG: PD-(D/E)XK nuclease family protein [Candidatus Bathyarchaeia archaeon]